MKRRVSLTKPLYQTLQGTLAQYISDEQLGQRLGILSWGQYLNHYLLFIYF